MSTEEMISQATLQISCTSWDDFKARVHRDYAEEMMGFSPLFRGHARSDWKLASPWDRKLEKWATNERERGRETRNHLLEKILEDFKELTVGLPGVKSRDLADLDWWGIGRHYGLITPLLDWTKSPYVAAFFAFTGFAEIIMPGVTTIGNIDPHKLLSLGSSPPVVVWALMAGERFWELFKESKELEKLNPHIDIGHRQRAQRGLFTRLNHSDYFDVEEYLCSLGLPEPPLRKYLIPGHELARVVMELRMMNITFATLFPDLSGAALQANFESLAFTLTAFSLVPSDIWTAHVQQVPLQESHNSNGAADG